MKDIRTLFVLLTSLLVTQAVSYSNSYSSTIVGDVSIQNLNNGSLFCDTLVCPSGTVSCTVTKRNSPDNFQVIVRHRKCLNGNGAILAEQIINEPNRYNSNVNTHVSSGGGFSSIQGGTIRQMTPQEQREFEENMRLTQERVQAQVSRSINQINRQMEPFLDGSFAANLNKQIRDSIRNTFH